MTIETDTVNVSIIQRPIIRPFQKTDMAIAAIIVIVVTAIAMAGTTVTVADMQTDIPTDPKVGRKAS